MTSSAIAPELGSSRARGGRHGRKRLKEVDRGDESDGDSDHLKSSASPVSSRPVIDSPRNEDPVSRIEEWEELGVPSPILRALRDLGFMSPTEIQRRAIPPAITEGCDIIGAAETVRGLLLHPTL